MRTHAIRPRRVHDFVSCIFDYDLHAKRVASLADATVGALQGAHLAVSALGRALAVAKNRDPIHAIKQVDRFFSVRTGYIGNSQTGDMGNSRALCPGRRPTR